jgi:release factor glutamine methyltransferase
LSTIGAALAAGRARLAAAGIESAALDARLLLAHAIGETQARIVGWPERTIEPIAALGFEALIERRVRREPVAHLLGTREFWGLAFRVSPVTLVPRPDSEAVVEAALAQVADRDGATTIVDVGTGTGCLLLALLHELPNASGIGVDLPPVLDLAVANARALGLDPRARFVGADDLAAVPPADLMVANLPYIPSAEIAALEPDVALYEPLSALDGGADGLDAFRMLAPRLPGLLRQGAVACLEVGAGQASAVEVLFAVIPGLEITGRVRDLAGLERVVCIRRTRG